jgi:hypothetical protein
MHDIGETLLLRNWLNLNLMPIAPGGLSGTYELRGDAIGGWVSRIPFSSNAGLRVEVQRCGETIAMCEVCQIQGRKVLPFTIPIEGRFTSEELVRQSVTVVARTNRGDTGTIQMDSANSWELTKLYLGEPIEVVFELDLTGSRPRSPLMKEGWFPTADQWTWTKNDDSVVQFATPTLPGDYVLRFRAGAFITNSTDIQSMEIYLDDLLLGSFSTRSEVSEFREYRFDGGLFSGSASSILRLHHSTAAAPSHDSIVHDTRRLAFSFRRLSLYRVLDA